MSSAALPLLAHAAAPLAPFFKDPETEDVAVNRPGEAWVRRRGAWERHDLPALDFPVLEGIAILSAALRGQDVGWFAPLLATEAPGPGGALLRLQACLPPAVPQGTVSLTWRRPGEGAAPLEDLPRRYRTEGWNRWDRRHELRAAASGRALARFDAGDAPGFLAEAMRARLNVWMCAATGGGKAQPLDAKVLTPTGWRRMGDLAVGDLVASPDGRIAPVIGVFPQGEKDIWRVTFEDGRVVECCDDHLWKIWEWSRSNDSGGVAGWSVRPLSAIRAWLAAGFGKMRRAAVPLVAPLAIEMPPQDLPIPPYALGALLGDGQMPGTAPRTGGAYGNIKLSSADPHIVDRVTQDLPDYEAVPIGEVDYRLRLKVQTRPSPLRIALANLGLAGCKAHEKFVPKAYKCGSASQRLALLQGLMDTEGSVAGKAQAHATFSTTSLRLARDVQEVAWSLGAIAKVIPRQTHYTDKQGQRVPGLPSYRVSIVHPEIASLFSLPRKVVQCRKKVMRHRLRIVSIRPAGRKPAQCIAIDHPDRLYVTDGYVATHNTTLLKSLMREVPEGERIVTVEDAAELVVPQPNTVRLLYSHGGSPGGDGTVTAEDLMVAALRMRPDRIPLQEVRTGEAAWVYLNGIMTGHPGSPTTIHGRSPAEAFRRMFALCKGTPGGGAMDDARLARMLADAVDVIIPLRSEAGAFRIGEGWFKDDAARRGETAADLLARD